MRHNGGVKMHETFKEIKKDGYGVVHVHNLGPFMVLPLKPESDLAKIGEKIHKKALAKGKPKGGK